MNQHLYSHINESAIECYRTRKPCDVCGKYSSPQHIIEGWPPFGHGWDDTPYDD